MKEMKKLIIITACILGVFYGYIYLFRGGVLLFWGDGADQAVQFYTYGYNLIRSGDLTFWNTSMGLGANIFTMFFTIFGAPSFYLTLLSPSKEYIVYAFAIIDIIRFFAISTISYLWISKLVTNQTARIIGAISFTFSGWMMLWFHFPYFMDVFVYIAILLYLCEEILENRKKLVFSVVIALLGVLSIYQLYMISWLLFFYLTCRYFMKKGIELKGYFRLFINIFLYYLLGIGLCAIIIIPCIFILMSTNRIVDVSTSLLSFISVNDVLRTLTSIISPVVNDYDYNIYFSSISNGFDQGNTVYNYTTILFAMLIPQLFKVKFQGKKILMIVTMILYSFLFIKFFYVLFNGNMSIRWSFIFIVFNIMILVYLFEYKNQWDIRLLKITSVFILIVIVLLTIISRQWDLVSALNRLSQKYIIPLLCFFVLAYFVVLFKKNSWIVYLLAVEMIMCLFLRIYNGNNLIIADGKEIWYYQSLINHDEIIEEVQSYEEENAFYRTEIIDTSNLGYNLPLANNYDGFTSYVSVFNNNSIPFYNNRFGNQWYIGYQPSKFLIKSLLGGQYLIDNGNNATMPHGYLKVFEKNGNAIYENSISTGLGYATSQVVSYNDLEDYDIFERDYAMMQAIVANLSTIRIGDIMEPTRIVKGIKNEAFKPLNDDGIYVLDYTEDDANSTCRFDMYYDGDEYDSYENYEIGYQSIVIEKKYNDIFVYCTSINNPNYYVKSNLYWLSNADIDNLYENLIKQDRFVNVVNKSDIITADINIHDTAKLVATNVAFDPGWKVYDNGKEVKVEIVNYGFVGFELEVGTHMIEMKFEPKGFEIGKYITIISIVIFCSILGANIKKRSE